MNVENDSSVPDAGVSVSVPVDGVSVDVVPANGVAVDGVAVDGVAVVTVAVDVVPAEDVSALASPAGAARTPAAIPNSDRTTRRAIETVRTLDRLGFRTLIPIRQTDIGPKVIRSNIVK
ncbi:MAG: hypothetical protein ABEJ28_01185 [Salinigranum sp.]